MATRTTAIYPYKDLVVSATGNETDLVALTGFKAETGLPAPATPLLAPKSLRELYAGGKHTDFNAVILRCYATCVDNNDCTMAIYGISRIGGSFVPERIATLLWTFGQALRSVGVYWAQKVTVTDLHIGDIRDADNGNNDRIVRVEFDVLGYEYLYAIVYATDTGAATNITVEMRPY